MNKAIALAASLALLAGCGMFSDRASNDRSAPAVNASAPAPQQSQAVADAQKALKQAGFDPGATDGVMGPRTVQALKDYQQAKGLQTTGRLDTETREALAVK